MKIRNGFVSNSSTSSFLICGVVIDTFINEEAEEKFMEKFCKVILNDEEREMIKNSKYPDDEKYELIQCGENDLKIAYVSGEDGGAPRGKAIVGKSFSVSEGDYMEIGLDELDGVKEKLKELGLKGPVKLIIGTRMS